MKRNKYFIKGNFIYRESPKNTFLKNPFTRKVCYYVQSIIFHLLLFINILYKRKHYGYQYRATVCSIFKDEAHFLKEWINYHLIIGVDHFILYNNNSSDNYMEVLQPYINKNIVELIDWPRNHSQMEAFKDCYLKNKNKTHWLIHIDIDEFICPLSTDNLNDWLNEYNNYPGVAIYWKQFGSSGRTIHNIKKLVIEQYTQCWEKYCPLTKMICNMDFQISSFDNPHNIKSKIFNIPMPPINVFKNIISFGVHVIPKSKQPSIQINHYWNKSLDMFEKKQARGDACFEDVKHMVDLRQELLLSHEVMCTGRDYSIQRFLLSLKIFNIK